VSVAEGRDKTSGHSPACVFDASQIGQPKWRSWRRQRHHIRDLYVPQSAGPGQGRDGDFVDSESLAAALTIGREKPGVSEAALVNRGAQAVAFDLFGHANEQLQKSIPFAGKP
jgi:hypothetical protein